MLKKQQRSKWWFGLAVVSVVTTALHLLGLTKLPVFADEAIYIRWAQLLIDDPARYLFFALNDGKTPLFIWLLAPWQLLFSDQLWAGRWLAVVVGVGQIWASAWLAKTLGGKNKAVFLAGVWSAVLPFWFWHHGLALMDGLLTVLLTLTSVAVVKITQNKGWRWALGGGVLWALALWTKVPAILIAPVLGIGWLFLGQGSWKERRLQLMQLVVMGGIAGFGFVSLAIAPAFSQLFNRGSDFLFPWQQVILQGGWQQTILNWPTYFSYFWFYLSWAVIVMVFAGLFSTTHRRQQHFLFWSALAFAFPIALLGRVVYPRYFLPSAFFFTIMAALTYEEWIERWIEKASTLTVRLIAGILLALLLGQIIATSGVFMAYQLWQPNRTPLVTADKAQYLADWSSGHGIVEAVALIRQYRQQGTVAVATEGFFGTLPDGLLLYFHRRNVDGIFIDGVGQPVNSIPSTFAAKARQFDRTLLVVNSHRLGMKLPPEKKVAEYCRPFKAPCLQVWDITDQIKQ